MLDNETKRRIDTARDILVGKVPDPKSQVEQITIALIYKFMDDMDAAAEELGGHRSFFTGDFEKYGWSKLVAPGRGGFEVLNLYAEAITKMNENAGIPLLFRDIFKNAYLPYRDPETLKSFLKVINDFTYDHSERLGDAFEYLLAVLGSQGDAGQFRTPRHIIDFMVQVIDPQKHESITDPACGTAGFLISSFKHIMNANRKDGRPGDALNPDERGRLMNQIRGYDISPDMVRLSLVNLYLHGFNDPHIVEYDTLTSEERWHEYADIILANPPFMSPKGGIKPHKRFSVQSSRSEVLFVDYIAEHLSPGGRAAVIVPEGVIFQSGNAYKQLRKMLVENYLVGVISLPAGVFNPYSGVKTSILWLDKSLAKQTNQIAFVKIENDGFDLGAQRREIKENDLPGALTAITAYKASLINNTAFDEESHNCLTLVDKGEIAENGDYNLSGERYQKAVLVSSDFPLVTLESIAEINPSKNDVKDLDMNLEVSFLPMSDLNENKISFVPQETRKMGDVIKGYTYFKDNDVLLAKITPCFENGKAGVAKNLTNGIGFGSTEYYVLRAGEKILPELLYYFVTVPKFRELGQAKMTGSAGQQRVPKDFVASYHIPLPPLAVQEEIVAELESYQKIIDGARQVVENWRPRIAIDPNWPEVPLGEITHFIDYRGKTPQKTNEGIPLITAKNVKLGYLNEEPREFIAEEDYERWMTRGIPNKGDVLFTTEAPLGNVAQIETEEQIALAQRLITFVPDRKRLIDSFLMYVLLTDVMQERINAHRTGSTVFGIKAETLKTIKIPVPAIEVQKCLVVGIEQEKALVQGNQELITLFEQKIKDRIARVWGAG